MKRQTIVAGAILFPALLLVALLAWPSGDPAGATGSNTIARGWSAVRAGSLAMDASGHPVVAFSSGFKLAVLHCGDPTCTSDNVVTQLGGASFGEQVGLSLAMDASGNPVVSYYNYTLEPRLEVLHCGDPNCSSGNTATPFVTENGQLTSLALDADGNPVVSYWDVTSYDLKLLRCGDPVCSSGNSIATVDSEGDVGASSSLELDESGNPAISYYDRTNRDLKVIRCGNATCTAGNTIATPDAGGDVGSSTSLELDDNDRPVVSYYDRTNRDLKLLRCGNAACTSGNSITSPDTVGFIGRYTSLALGNKNLPVVAYYDDTNRDLKVLRCGSSTCGGANSITAPDEEGDVGVGASLALDNSGNPVVSYMSSGYLSVLHCGNPACLDPKPPPTPTPTPKDPNADTDGDGTPNGTDLDDDNDGCTDDAEEQTAKGSETSGGKRNAHNFWDLMSVFTGNPLARDTTVSVGDIGAVVGRFGANDTGAGSFDRNSDPLSTPNKVTGNGREDYHPAYDRGGTDGPYAWNLLPPDGAIGVGDIAAAVAQFGHSCL